MSWSAFGVFGMVAEVGSVSDPAVDPVAEYAPEPVESAERASPPTTSDSASLQPSSPYYTGSPPRSCIAAVTASVEPWWVVEGAAQQRPPVVDQGALAIAKSVGCSR